MNVLVTGGAGFIGSHLVDALIARGHRVRVLDALIPQVHPDRLRPAHLDDRAELIVGDIADPAAVDAALEGMDVVFHFAAEVGVGQSMYEIERYVRANTYGTSVLLQLIANRTARPRKLVVASSMSIYGEGLFRCGACGPVAPGLRPLAQLEARQWDPLCPACGAILSPLPTHEDKPLLSTSVYAITKKDQEELSLNVGRAYGVPTVALRFFNVYGPRQALSNPYTGVCAIFSSRLLNGQSPLIFEDGAQSRDFTHVSDIVQANVLAMETNGADYQAVNVGTGRSLSVLEAARILARGLGTTIEPTVLGKFREGDIRHCVADLTRAQRTLGYQPKVSLEQGMPDLIAWVGAQQATDKVVHATSELEQRQLVK
jgi:dTDP-L-rhamnose 4-epimerase